MLVESAIGHLSAEKLAVDSIDWLDLNWLDCRRRFGRKQTRGGLDVRLLLRLGEQLRHGDVLGYWPQAQEGKAVVVNVLATDVFVVRFDGLGEGAMERVAIAYEIGNLHQAMQVTESELLVPCGHESAALLQRLVIERGIAYTADRRVFEPTQWPTLVQRAEDLRIDRRGEQESG